MADCEKAEAPSPNTEIVSEKEELPEKVASPKPSPTKSTGTVFVYAAGIGLVKRTLY